MVTTTFQFIDNSLVGSRQSRRTIRSHVMKGKNTGKVRIPKRTTHQPPRVVSLKPLPLDATLPVRAHVSRRERAAAVTEAAHDDGGDDAVTHKEIINNVTMAEKTLASKMAKRPVSSVNRPQTGVKLMSQLGNDLSCVALAGDLTPESRYYALQFFRYVAEALYPAEFCLGAPDPHMVIWYQYLFIDETYFHAMAALSEACMDFVAGRNSCSRDYRHHVSMALRLMNERLSTTDGLSDASLASVMMLCLLSSIREEPWQTSIHFDGLCRMIDLRGGMEALSGNPALAEKAHRIDIDLALQLGCPTRLGRSAKPLDSIVPIFTNPAFEVRCPLINAVRNVDAALLEATEDVCKMMRLFNSGTAAKKLGPSPFQEMITTMCCRLVDMKPIAEPTGDMHPVARAVQLALLSYLTTFFIMLGRERRMSYEILSEKLMEALDDADFKAAIDPASHIWLLVVGGISVLEDGKLDWLKPRMASAVGQFGIDDWSFTRRLLSKYPWVGVLHDGPAHQLWDSCFGHGIEGNY